MHAATSEQGNMHVECAASCFRWSPETFLSQTGISSHDKCRTSSHQNECMCCSLKGILSRICGSLRPNAYSPLPSMAVLNAAALVETFLIESPPVRVCSAGKTSGSVLSSTSCTGKNFSELFFPEINHSSS